MQLDDFITYIVAEKRYSDHTALNYRRDISRFISDVAKDGEFDPCLVSTDDIRRWIVSLTEKDLSAATVNRMTSALRSFFHWLRKTGVVEKDPFVKVGFQRTPSRLPAYIPESKMGDVTDPGLPETEGNDFENRRNYLIVMLFYTTGMRLAELLNVKIKDFSADFGELRVKGKGNKERIIPVVDFTRRKIVEYMDLIKSENIWTSNQNSLFLNKNGEPLSRSSVYRVVRRWLAQADVQGKRSPHILRHTFATHMLNDGADIKEIQDMLGHSSLSATQVYTHNSITKLKEVYDSAHPRSRWKEE